MRTREALAGDAAEIAFASDRAIERGIADDDRALGDELDRLLGRIDDDAAARQALADIIVGLALQFERHAIGEKGAEALARRTLQLDMDRFVAQAGMAVAARDLARQHRAGRAIRIADRHFEPHMLGVFDRLAGLGDEAPVEDVVEAVILRLAAVDRIAGRRLRLVEQVGEIEAPGLPMFDHLGLVEHLPLADHFVEAAIAQRGHQFAHFFGDEEEEIDDMFGQADEALAQHRVLRRDADRAGVEMALAHHDAARRDQRRGGKAEFVGAEQRGDDDVASGPQAAVRLHGDARAQTVQHQRLMRLGQADLPGRAGMLDRGQRRSAGAPFKAGNRDMIGLALGDARRDRADADFRDELDRHRRLRIDVLQIEDELLEILDRIDVVMRRRRNEADALRRMAHLGDDRVDLVAGQLAAFAGLGALRHLDLHHVGIDEIFGGHAEAPRGDLLDRRAHRIAIGHPLVAIGFLAAFAGVRLAADPVHRDGERGVRLARDRAVRHRAGGEALDDVLGRLDLFERHGLAPVLGSLP